MGENATKKLRLEKKRDPVQTVNKTPQKLVKREPPKRHNTQKKPRYPATEPDSVLAGFTGRARARVVAINAFGVLSCPGAMSNRTM